jgi:hypothetical protein
VRLAIFSEFRDWNNYCNEKYFSITDFVIVDSE